ncbi:MAG TPA: hypothetical protein VK324_10020 [Tepidisphaeraceae bacterium]|nr:hypothetical protein [Tepidisphaeraceae bacterium]
MAGRGDAVRGFDEARQIAIETDAVVNREQSGKVRRHVLYVAKAAGDV